MPTASPMPIMGPMSGDTSIAPIITAVELTFRPSEAMNMAKISTHSVEPRKLTPSLISLIISSSFSTENLKNSLARVHNSSNFGISL